jgi:CBS domain-containing protein
MRNRNINDFDEGWQRSRREAEDYRSERGSDYGRDYGRDLNNRDVSNWRSTDRDYEGTTRAGDLDNYNNRANAGFDYRNDIDSGRDYGRQAYGDRRWEQGTQRATGRTYYSHLRCRDIMTKDVTTCTPETTIAEVARLMRDEDVGAIPVIQEGKLAGIVTDRDIVVRAIADKNQNLLSVTVKDVMSDDVYSVRPNDRLVDAIRKMGDKQVRRILVTDSGGRLRGIISMADVALESDQDRELADALEEISESKSWFGRLFS